jgi:hypothetical protein
VLQSSISGGGKLVSLGALCHVPVVIANHLQKEGLALCILLSLHCIVLD